MNATRQIPGRKPIDLKGNPESHNIYAFVRDSTADGMVLEDVAIFLKISTPTLYRKIKADPELAKAVQEGRKKRTKAPYRKQDTDFWDRWAIYRRQKSHQKVEQREALFNSPFNGEEEDSFYDSGWIAYKTNMNILVFVRKGDFKHLLKLVEMDNKYSCGNNWHAGKQGPGQEFKGLAQHGYPSQNE